MITIILLCLAALLLIYQAYRDIWRAVLVVIILIPAYVVRISIAGIPTTIIEVAIWLLVIVYLSQSSGRRRWRRTWAKLPWSLKLWTALFMLAAVMSTLISSQPTTSLGILKGWVITPLAFAYLIFTVPGKKQLLKQILYALISSATAVSLIAWIMGVTNGRLQAIYDTPNSVALYIAPIVVATLWHIITQKKYRPILITAAVIQALAVLGSQSVMAALSILGALAVATVHWAPTRLKKPTIIGLVVGVLLCTAIFWATGKLSYIIAPLTNSAIHNSINVRLQLWSISRDLIQAHPIVGVGLGQFEPNYQAKLHERFALYAQQLHTNPPLAEFVFRDPHNWPLSFWMNTGLLGLISFSAINILVLTKAWFTKDSVAQAVGILLLCYLLFGLADTIYWKNDLAILFWLSVVSVVKGSSNALPTNSHS